MVATGPRLPKPIGGDMGGDEPLRISLGEGMMGESARLAFPALLSTCQLALQQAAQRWAGLPQRPVAARCRAAPAWPRYFAGAGISPPVASAPASGRTSCQMAPSWRDCVVQTRCGLVGSASSQRRCSRQLPGVVQPTAVVAVAAGGTSQMCPMVLRPQQPHQQQRRKQAENATRLPAARWAAVCGPAAAPSHRLPLRCAPSAPCPPHVPHILCSAPLPTTAGGGFTNVDPESRRIVPEAHGRTKLKVVYVVLEAQYQASLSAAVNKINTHRKEVRAAGGAANC